MTLDAHKSPIRPAPRGLLLGHLSSHFSESCTRIRFAMRHQVYELIDDKDKRIRDRIADKTIGHHRVTVCVCKTRREFSLRQDNDDSLTNIFFKGEKTHKVRTVRKIA